jgi:hypothetical protein
MNFSRENISALSFKTLPSLAITILQGASEPSTQVACCG